MAAYCGNCGAKLDEKDEFCGNCGAAVPKEAGAAKKESGSDSGKYRMIGIAVVAVAVVLVVGLLLKGGKSKDPAGTSPEDPSPAETTPVGSEEEEDETLSHLRPWMGDWIMDREVNPDHPMAMFNYDNEGYYNGEIFQMDNIRGLVHVTEEYIDFSNLTKNEKDRFPVSSLEYSATDYGAEIFTDPNSQIRFVFYDHHKTSENGTDYGVIMHIQAYVGHDEAEVTYIGDTPIATSHSPAPDGWAADDKSYTKLE